METSKCSMWIPISKKIPNQYDKVLCLMKSNREVVSGFIAVNKDGIPQVSTSQDFHFEDYGNYEVTHWMPMPELPKKFSTPCFVKCEDEETIRDLMEFCSQLGYRVSNVKSYIKMCKYVFVDGEKVSSSNNSNYLKNRIKAIDCGSNIELFKDLASMQSDIYEGQWFYWDNEEDEGEKMIKYIDDEHWQNWWWYEVRRATAGDIIDYHKRKTM